jgi:hypothetical protein
VADNEVGIAVTREVPLNRSAGINSPVLPLACLRNLFLNLVVHPAGRGV